MGAGALLLCFHMASLPMGPPLQPPAAAAPHHHPQRPQGNDILVNGGSLDPRRPPPMADDKVCSVYSPCKIRLRFSLPGSFFFLIE